MIAVGRRSNVYGFKTQTTRLSLTDTLGFNLPGIPAGHGQTMVKP